MRLSDFEGSTSLPVDAVRAALPMGDVLSVLPATAYLPLRDCLLVATSRGLAIVTRRRLHAASAREVAIRWVRWNRVSLGADPELSRADDDTRFDLDVRAGRRTFHALLEGQAGRVALREFVVAVQRGIRGLGGYVDYDAASMLDR